MDEIEALKKAIEDTKIQIRLTDSKTRRWQLHRHIEKLQRRLFLENRKLSRNLRKNAIIDNKRVENV